MEQDILKQYQLRSFNPSSWEKDTVHDQLSNDDNSLAYTQLLEDISKDDIETSPQLLDPIDVLNSKQKIKTVLKAKGLDNISDDDLLKLSIGSKSFNSKVYLKLIHQNDSFNELVNSLSFLEKSIEHQEDELKVLINQEYLKFVRSKTSLDDVLNQFQKKGFSDLNEDDNKNGLKVLRNSMNDANKETAVLVKPIVSSKMKEDKLLKAIEFVEKRKFFFNLSKDLKNSLKQNDYDDFIRNYKKGKQLREDDDNLEGQKVIDKIWENVEIIVDSYKKQLWSLLTNDANQDDFLKIIKKLIELDEIDNPILEWIEFKSKSLLSQFNDIFNKHHDKILNLQLNIIYTISQQNYTTFKSVLNRNIQLLDYTSIIEMWLMISKLFNDINLIIQNFIKFWNNVECFINGDFNEKLSSSYISENCQFLNFQNYEINEIKLKGEKFINQILNKLIKFFTSTQDSLKRLNNINSADNQKNSSNELNGLVKDFGFLPPHTNSLSTLRYLPLISTQTFKILNDLGQLTITDRIINELRDSSDLITERFIGAVCATWLNDCQNFYKLEDWVRLSNGETSIPNLILNFESFILEKIDYLLLKSLPSTNNNVSIVRYPKQKYLNGVQTQFLRSFDVLLESIIKKIIEEGQNSSINKNVKNVHKLLTFFNLKKLTNSIIPSLIVKFDSIFDTNLQNENLEIYAILDKLEKTIFDSYMNEQKKIITNILTQSIHSTDWSDLNTRVSKVSKGVYEAINVLISVYIGVLNISSELIESVFQHLLEHSSSILLKNFREVTNFNDNGFKQVVLDIEFFKSLIGKSSNETIDNNFKLIYKNFSSNNLNIKIAYESIGDILDESLRCSTLEYEIFNS